MTTIGFAVCGSFCTFKAVFEEIKKLKNMDYDIVPIMSENSYSLDTRFVVSVIRSGDDHCVGHLRSLEYLSVVSESVFLWNIVQITYIIASVFKDI